ncbi:uncharacterized protein [Epargyreus clarus]|uniref:uncharacterized protein isoform X1 n=1 Tax=Epargyreus clarus TaxID=520877 RepID=UPI003C30D814
MATSNEIIKGLDSKKLIKYQKFKVISTVDDNDPNFPEDRVKRIIDELDRNNLTMFFSNIQNKPSLDNNTENYTKLCQSESGVYKPTIIQSEDGSKHIVLNSKYRIIQEVRFETCLNSSDSSYKDIYGECEYTADKDGWLPLCRQEYVRDQIYTVLVSESKPSEIEIQYVKIPSCCSCYLYRRD